MFGSKKTKDEGTPSFTFKPSEALQAYMAEVHDPSLDFTDPNDIGEIKSTEGKRND